MEQQPEQKVKRRVGRPKLVKPAPQSSTRKGIVAEPNVPDHALEMVYDEPINLKKIFMLFKLMDTRDVKMEFRLTGVRISGAGHLKHNFIDLNINSANLSQYYCRHNIIMIIDQKNLEKVIQKIDKSYNNIHFIAKHDSCMKELYIVLNDEAQGIKEYHTISLLESSNTSDDNLVSSLPYTNYPLSFTLPSKYFKKVIGDISKFSKDFTVERRPGVLLSFPYDSNSKTIDVNHVFTNPELFKINSSLPDTEFISTTVRIEYIQSLATALLSDNINVFVDHENMMVFRTTIDDGTFTLLLAVKIVSYK
jgi:Proliferating cell nuclear antigen, N-terminal domain